MGVDFDESSEFTGVQSSLTSSVVAPTPAAVPCGRAAPAGGRGTTVASSLTGAATKETPDSPVCRSSSTPGGFAMSTLPATSAGVKASGGTASPGASVESSPSVLEEAEANGCPSPKLGGGAARELRWLGNPRRPARRRRAKAALFNFGGTVCWRSAYKELQELLSVFVIHYCLTGIDGLYKPLLLGAVNDTETLAASTTIFARGTWLDPPLDSRNGFGAVVSTN